MYINIDDDNVLMLLLHKTDLRQKYVIIIFSTLNIQLHTYLSSNVNFCQS